MPKGKVWSKDEIEFVNDNPQMSKAELAKRLKRTESAIGVCRSKLKFKEANETKVIAYIKCPYFIQLEYNGMACEGVCGKCNTVRFNTDKECEIHKRRYCFSIDYNKCAMARAIEIIKYPEGGKRGNK